MINIAVEVYLYPFEKAIEKGEYTEELRPFRDYLKLNIDNIDFKKPPFSQENINKWLKNWLPQVLDIAYQIKKIFAD